MLSQQSRYALKALLHLAHMEPGKPHPAGKIASATNVPRKYLETILLEMKAAGIVHSTRGKQGGYALARSPMEITFGEVIRWSDGPIALTHCTSKNFYRRCLDCSDETACELRRVMVEAREKLSVVLDNHTLADAIGQPPMDFLITLRTAVE